MRRADFIRMVLLLPLVRLKAAAPVVIATWPVMGVRLPGYTTGLFHPCILTSTDRFDFDNPEHFRMVDDAMSLGIGQSLRGI